MQQDGLDVSEVYFLVLNWLSNGPCRGAAEALLQEVEQHGLLPKSECCVTGASRPTGYQQLLQQHSRVPSTGLLQLLQQALDRVQHNGYPGAQGLSTLLAEGPLAALPALQQPLPPKVPPWISRPLQAACTPQQLLLREAGVVKGSSSRRLPLHVAPARFSHHATFRGHGFPVFSLLFDKQGSRIVTGADDAIIKVWSVHTGLLLVSARGHTGEITDLSLSCDGELLASGATDAEVRVWSMKDCNLGQNLAVLRGHQGPINLISFHPTLPLALLSSSSDGTVRLWDASDQHLAPQVLAPAQHAAAQADTAAGGGPADGHASAELGPFTAHVRAVVAAVAAGAAHIRVPEGSPEDEEAAMLCCAWSRDGTYIVAGNADCNTYVWHWDVQTCRANQPQLIQQQQVFSLPEQQQRRQAAGSGNAPSAAAEVLHAADWPQPVALPTLSGHGKGVWQVEFSHAGTMLATGSMDSTVRVYVCGCGTGNGRGQPGSGSADGQWQLACPPLRLVRVPSADGAGVGSPAPRQKQRRPQAPEELTVNKILWVADDSKLLAAACDRAIRVWDTKSWSLLMLLQGHSDTVHVLSGHPFDPRVVLSAGYDGRIILWDTATGAEIQRFSSSDTIPLARGSWAPPVIQVIEGRFSPDGTAFAVSDVAGQFSLYSQGPPPPLILAAPYDQFFSRDYDPIVHDASGFAAYADPDTGVVVAPVWQAARQYAVESGPTLQQPLCDNHFRPYSEGFQAAYRAGRMFDYVNAGQDGMCLRGSSMNLPSSLELWPPTVTAAVWKALEDRSALAAKRSSVPSEQATRDAAERSAMEQHSRLLAALARGMTLEEEQLHLAQLQAATAAAAAAGGQQQEPRMQQLPQPGVAATNENAIEEAGQQQQQQQQGPARLQPGSTLQQTGGVSRAGDDFIMNFMTEEDVLQDLLNDREGDVGADNSDSDYSASAQQEEASSSGDPDDLGSDGGYSNDSGSSGGSYGGGSRRRSRQSKRRPSRRQRRERRAAAAAAAAAGGGHNLRPRRQRGDSSQPEDEPVGIATRSRPHTRSASAQGTPDAGEQHLLLPGVRVGRRKRRAPDSDSSSAEEEEQDGTGISSDEEPRQRRQQQRRTRRRLDPAAAAAAGREGTTRQQDRQLRQQNADAAAAGGRAAGAAGGGDPAPQGQDWRPGSCYSWLSSRQQLPGVYAPQLGDAVVYLWQGHQQYLDSNPGVQAERPWLCLQQLGLAAWQQQQQWLQQQEQYQGCQQQSYDPGGQVQQAEQQQALAGEVADQPQQQEPTETPVPAAAADADADADADAAGTLLVGTASTAATGAAGAAAATPAAAANADPQPAAAAAGGSASSQSASLQTAIRPVQPTDDVAAAAAGSVSAAAAASTLGGAAAAAATSAGMGAGQQAGWVPLAAGAGRPFELRPAEPCVVVGLEYVTLPDDHTAALLTLQLSDPTALATATAAAAAAAASGYGMSADPAAANPAEQAATAAVAAAAQGCFQVLMPPPGPTSKPFIVQQPRYLASLEHLWQPGDRVQGSRLSEDSAESCVRLGTITAVANSSSSLPPSQLGLDPCSCSSTWQLYQVCWDDSSSCGDSRPKAAADVAAGCSKEAGSGLAANGSQPVEDAGGVQEAAATTVLVAAAPHAAAESGSWVAEAAAAAAAAGAAAEAAAGAAAAQPPAPPPASEAAVAVVAAAAAGAGSCAGVGEQSSSWHSPWELVPPGSSAEAVLAAEHTPGLPAEQVVLLLQSVERLRSRQYKFFSAPPSPAARFVTKSQVRAYNRVVPLPLGLADIQARLESGYYRSMQAVLHDAALIASNAATFNGADSEFASKAMQMYTALAAAAYPQGQQHQQQPQQQQQQAAWPAVGGWPQQMLEQHQHGYGTAAGLTGSVPMGCGDGDGHAAMWGGAAAAADAAGTWQGQWYQHAGPECSMLAAAAGAADGSTAQGAAHWSNMMQQQQQAQAGGYHAVLQEQQEPAQQRPRLRLRLRPTAPTGQGAALPVEDMTTQRRSGRHQGRQHREEPVQQEQRSRRSAAQRARVFMADFAAVARVGSGSSESQQPSESAGDSDDSAGGARRRHVPVRPTRHSARLQQQQGARRQRHDEDDASESGADS